MPPAAPEIRAAHALTRFDSGQPTLDAWPASRAPKNERGGGSPAYVVCEKGRVVAYCRLAAGSVVHGAAPGNIRRNMPDPIPVMLQQDVFRDTRHSVVFQDPITTRQALDALDRKPSRYVLAPRRLSAPERHGLYMGLERRNQVLLLEPRDHRMDHLVNPDMQVLVARFTIYASYADHDLASQPAAYRGALSGTGSLDVQLEITVQGPMNKAILEQHCEQLSDVPDAVYAGRVRIEAPAASEAPEVEPS